MAAAPDLDADLAEARRLAASGNDAAARRRYLQILHQDPTHFAVLIELGNLAYAASYREAARSAYEQAVLCHPGNPVGRVNLGNLLAEEGEFAAARGQYEAALAADPDLAEAHQGLARMLLEEGRASAAEPHFRRGFTGRSLVARPYRGAGTGIAVLLLVSARGGNIPTRHLLDDRRFAVTALYADFHDPAIELPRHDIVFNAIGEADLCGEALAGADAVLARTTAPVINPPARIRPTGRAENAQRLAGIAGLVVPAIRATTADALLAAPDLAFPLLLRAPGFHTGRNFLRVEQRADLAAAVAALPAGPILHIAVLNARGADGMARKYRVMIIDGGLYPLHLAISADWKVHYFSAGMATNAAWRAEEQRFLDDMPGVLGAQAAAALEAIGRRLALDYAGVDFGLSPDGRVLLFEANAAMVINPPDPDPLWDYRRPAIERALDAARRMVAERAEGSERWRASRPRERGARCGRDRPRTRRRTP
jgi:tetratricopeptide (TPR) repeat protein